MNGGVMSSHSLKTQMVTQYAQSGPPGARCNGIACWQGETNIAGAYADILQAGFG